MTPPDKPRTNPPDPRVEENPGYAERQPRNREDAQRDAPKHKPDPDEGGLDRAPEGSPDPAKD
ncbi:MAG: hypothetical protein M3485_04655 [Pseudomonadota bacterium]|nr:hypothetical protein [Pseudomonadota bacterium]